MANRFTDDQKWNDPWFCALTPGYKLFWSYLCDNCNHAGIWKVNWALVKFHTWEEKIEPAVFGNRIVVLNEEKWFIKGFVMFQQKVKSLDELNPDNNSHRGILRILDGENLLKINHLNVKGLKTKTETSLGAKDEIQNVVSPTGKGKVKVFKVNNSFKPPTLQELMEYCSEHGYLNSKEIEIYHNTREESEWIKANKQPVKNWKLDIKTWHLRKQCDHPQSESTMGAYKLL